MANQILSEEFRRMQKLAGIITEEQYLEEISLSGVFDKVKNKVIDKVKQVVDKFSDEEISKMKDIIAKTIGKPADELSLSDINIDNIKKIGKAISGLNEETLNEGLGDKIQQVAIAIGLPSMFLGGNWAWSDERGLMVFIAGAVILAVGLIVGSIVRDKFDDLPDY
jgi:hypothetical protein